MGFVEPTKFTWSVTPKGIARSGRCAAHLGRRAIATSRAAPEHGPFPPRPKRRIISNEPALISNVGTTSIRSSAGASSATGRPIWWIPLSSCDPRRGRGYWQLLEGHVLPYFGNQAMERLTTSKSSGTSPRNARGPFTEKVRDAVSVVSLVMKCAVKANARKDNPAADHTIRVVRRKVRPGDVPDMATMERLVTHIKDPYKTRGMAVGLYRHSPSELCGLRVRNIDLLARSRVCRRP